MLVYQKVRQYIEEHGIKQKTVAESCNFNPSTFNAMLNGKRKMYADVLRLICYALNVSPEIFINCEQNNV